MRSPEVSPSSLDVVIAPVICWQKRGTEKIWQLGKTSTPLNADVAQSVEHAAFPALIPGVGSSPTVCTRSSAPAKYKLERASGDRAQEGSRNVYLSGLTASSRHAAVTAGKDRFPPHGDVAESVIAFCNSRQEQPCVSDTGAHTAHGGSNPPISTIGVTSCLAAARSVSLRKWSFLCAVRKRQDE